MFKIILFSVKTKAFDDTVHPKGFRLGFFVMKDISFTPRKLTKKGKKIWYLYALIPKEVRQQNNTDPILNALVLYMVGQKNKQDKALKDNYENCCELD